MTNQEFIESISLEGEIWKDVIGYEELSFGRVMFKRRFRNNGNGGYLMPPKLCHLMETKFGYLQARLWENNKEKKCYVHRLVATSHPYSRGEPNELYEVQIKSRNVLEHYGLHE